MKFIKQQDSKSASGLETKKSVTFDYQTKKLFKTKENKITAKNNVASESYANYVKDKMDTYLKNQRMYEWKVKNEQKQQDPTLNSMKQSKVSVSKHKSSNPVPNLLQSDKTKQSSENKKSKGIHKSSRLQVYNHQKQNTELENSMSKIFSNCNRQEEMRKLMKMKSGKVEKAKKKGKGNKFIIICRK